MGREREKDGEEGETKTKQRNGGEKKMEGRTGETENEWENEMKTEEYVGRKRIRRRGGRLRQTSGEYERKRWKEINGIRINGKRKGREE